MQARRVTFAIVFLSALLAAVVLKSRPERPTARSPNAEKVASDPQPPRKATARPSVLLVSLDTVRADHLGSYGYDRPITPNLDALAARAVRFSKCRSQAPWTLPSHMSLFTSMLPGDNGVDNLSKRLPPDVPTLAELLKEAGYRTEALVNNGQMKAHWGFDRGFQSWREFEVDTPEGSCERITAEAIDRLRRPAGDRPLFLFLHYYDAHDPYEAPEHFRKMLGADLTGPECRQIAFEHRFPGKDIADERTKRQLIAAYDAEIAWLDHELGRLLSSVPKDMVVVVFSDHGEAFEEHGWMLHGASLYEEEIRVPLVVRTPEAAPAVIDEPVMLLDVAPTILSLCGVASPVRMQGSDLAALWRGGKLPDRLIPSESKAVLEGRYLVSVATSNAKAVYSLLDGRFELFKLPDERTNLAERDPAASKTMFGPLRDWVSTESFWLIHAAGRGDFEVTVASTAGRFGTFIPVGMEDQDRLEISEDSKTISWQVHPSGVDHPKSLFIQPGEADASIQLDFKLNGTRLPSKVFLGPAAKPAAQLPIAISPEAIGLVSPAIEKPFRPPGEGLHVFLHRGPNSRSQKWRSSDLDPGTIEKLRSLGYMN